MNRIKLLIDKLNNKINYFIWKWPRNILNPFKYPGFLWLLKLRFRHIILTLTVTHGTALISIFASLLTTTAILYYQNKIDLSFLNLSSEIKLWEILLIFSIWVSSFTVFISLLNYFLFKKTPPKNYANITVGGASFSEAISLLSYETWKTCLCYQCKINNKSLTKIAESIINEGKNESSLYSIPLEEKMLIKRSIDLMKQFENQQQRYLQNIFQLKILISEQYLISQRRLCDYIIQFSPSIYEELFTKYRSIWNEVYHISEINALGRPELKQRLYSLANASLRVHKSIIELIEYQIQLIEFKNLHNYVHSIAYDLSTSSSLKNYIEALSEIAKKSNNKFQEQLKFMYIKRNAHSGFDLHKAAINFCDQYSSQDSEFEKIKIALLKIKETKSAKLKEITKTDILPLKEFFVLFHSRIVAARNEIIKDFINRYHTEIINPPSQNTLLVIQGYSKTVRQMVKKGFKALKAEDKNFTPKVFLLKSKKEGKEMLNTRLMRVELKSDQIYNEFKRDTFSGDETFLLSLLRPGLKVVLFLGAECFDMKNGKIGRSMHINGISDRINHLKDIIKQKTQHPLKVILAAEGYKKYDDLLDIQEFYKDRLDPIDVYLPGMIDMLITDI